MQELINKPSSQDTMLVSQKAELDVQISTAKFYPRNIENSVSEALSIISSDKTTAEECFYCLPRAGKEIRGASIRLAEIIAYTWGNLHAGTRVIGNDGNFVTAEAVAWDLQKNTKQSAEIRRSIKDKYGKTYNADMQVVTANAAASIALRNAIFRIIPKHIINKLYDQAVKTAMGDNKSLAQLRQEGVAWFKKAGVKEETIFSYFGIPSIDHISRDNVTSMIGMKNALIDGTLSIDNAFSRKEVQESSKNQELNKTMDEWVQEFDKGTGELKS